MPEFCSAGVKNRYSLKQHFIINFGFTLKKSREACDTLLSPPLPSRHALGEIYNVQFMA